jgi:uncharacterized membrane protein
VLYVVGRVVVRLVFGPLPPGDGEAGVARTDVVPQATGGRALGRLTGFSDNVYAFAITLLILPLVNDLPDPPVTSAPDLTDHLTGALDIVGPAALGFAVIGLFWSLHVRTFSFIRAQDRFLQVLNLVHLMAVATLPFATSLLSAYDTSPTAVIAYALVAGLCGAMLAAMTFYASAGHRLIDPEVDPALIELRRWSSVVVPTAFAASIALAPLHPRVAQLLWYAGFLAVRLWQRRWLGRHPGLTLG